MSQLFDYFVCSRTMIEQWSDALEQQDEERQQSIESEMAHLEALENIGQGEFNILACCIEGIDPMNVVHQLDLVRAIDEEEGPWIMAFHQPAIEAIAAVALEKNLIQSWIKGVSEFHGGPDERWREILTTDAASYLKRICSLAVEKGLNVFTCFYG